MRYLHFASILLLLSLFSPCSQYAQDSIGISYQAIVRTAEGTLTSDTVGVQISILQASVTGQPVYTERHTSQTDPTGLLTLEIGTGTATNGAFFNIDWAHGPYFARCEIDPEGDTTYSIIGTFQLLSVPYALYAKRAGRSIAADTAQGVLLQLKPDSDTLFIGADSVMLVIPGLDSANPPRFPAGFVNCDTFSTQIVTVVSTTEKIWMDRNLGASRVAMSLADSLAYGDLYQWGRFADGHQCRNSTTVNSAATTSTPFSGGEWDGKFIINQVNWLSTPDDELWQGVEGANNPCPTGFRLPTIVEWQNEADTWVPKKASGAYNSPLKLPAAGLSLYTDGVPIDVGSWGNYWSSTTVSTRDVSKLGFSSSRTSFNGGYRSNGMSVRCIKD